MGPGEQFYSLADLLFLEANWSWTRRNGTTSARRKSNEGAGPPVRRLDDRPSRGLMARQRRDRRMSRLAFSLDALRTPSERGDPPSEPAPSSIPAELTRHPLGRYLPAHLVELLVLQDRLAVDGVLEPFESTLEMLDPRLKRLESPLPSDPRPHGSKRRRHTRCAGLAWLSTSRPSLVGYPRERKRE
jgi:hypothetical protein